MHRRQNTVSLAFPIRPQNDDDKTYIYFQTIKTHFRDKCSSAPLSTAV